MTCYLVIILDIQSTHRCMHHMTFFMETQTLKWQNDLGWELSHTLNINGEGFSTKKFVLAKTNGIRSNPMAIPLKHVLPVRCNKNKISAALLPWWPCHQGLCCLLWSKFVGLLKIICPVFFWFCYLMVSIVVFRIPDCAGFISQRDSSLRK